MRLHTILYLMFLMAACENTSDKPLVNTAHLDNLYKEIVLNRDTVAFVYIYAEHPDYHPVEAVGEGVACVDDVARAAIFYFRFFEHTQEKQFLEKGKKLIRFILHMQAENGMYYNFIRYMRKMDF